MLYYADDFSQLHYGKRHERKCESCEIESNRQICQTKCDRNRCKDDDSYQNNLRLENTPIWKIECFERML